jgi:hypothetical protein
MTPGSGIGIDRKVKNTFLTYMRSPAACAPDTEVLLLYTVLKRREDAAERSDILLSFSNPHAGLERDPFNLTANGVYSNFQTSRVVSWTQY